MTDDRHVDTRCISGDVVNGVSSLKVEALLVSVRYTPAIWMRG